MWIFEFLERLRTEWPTTSIATLVGLGATLGWGAAWLIFRQQVAYRGDVIEHLRATLKNLIEKNIPPEIAGRALKETGSTPRAASKLGVIVATLGMVAAVLIPAVYIGLKIERIDRDNFPYIRAEITEPSKVDGSVQLALAVLGKGGAPQAAMWMSPGSANRNAKDPAYWSMFGLNPPFVVPGGNVLPISVKPGSYWVEVDTQYGHIIEHLRILEFRGKLIQLIDITKDGRLVYRSPRPEGYSDP